jgi:Flp pilus assembly protein TadD
MRLLVGVCGFVFCGIAFAQQLPPGTREADAPSQADAVNARIQAAEGLLEKQDYRGAVVKLKSLATERPKDARVLYDLGYAEERDNDEAGAAVAYASAIAANPTVGEPRVALGLLDARAGRLEKAHEELLGAAKLGGEAPVLRGRALRALARMDAVKDPVAAREELIQAVKLTEETPDDVLMGADLAAQAGDDADAEAAYRRAVELDPTDVDAVAGLTHALVKQKKTAEAETVLAGALKAHPDDPRVVSQLAVLYASEDKATQAIPLMEKLRAGRASYASDPEMTGMLAHLYELNGDDAKAEALYRGLVEKNSGDPEMLDELGSVLVKQQKYAEAESVLTKAVSMREQFATQQDWGLAAEHLGYAASKNAQPRVALQALAERDTVLPSSPSSLWLVAISHDALHERKEAAVAYRAFLAIANGKLPNEEFEARHRLVALDNMK